MNLKCPILFIAAILFACTSSAQQQVTSIVTSTSTTSIITYNNVRGAGQKNSMGAVSSLWDSVGNDFTVNFNASANSVTSLQQFTVAGHPDPFIKQPVTAIVKIRRTANGFVT